MGTSDAFGGGSAKSKRFVLDVTDAFQNSLIPALQKAATLSERVQTALRGSSPGGNSTGAGSMSGASQPPINPSTGGPNLNTGSPIDEATNIGDFSRNAPSARQLGFSGSSSMDFSKVTNAIKSMGSTMLAAGIVATQPDDFIFNDIAKRRYGFYEGEYGPSSGGSQFQSMMNAGTPTDYLDAAKASMAGNSMGLMTGLSNYKDIGSSAASLSNIMPGVGLTGGMGALGALNQGSSVNKLRMIGVQVRNNNGLMRGIEEIAKDVWDQLNKIKGGKGNITTQDLSFSLQPGMSLDMMLNQYFNGDPVLREGIVSYLYQYASGKGNTNAGRLATGATPAISTTIGQRASAEYKVTNKFTDAGISGITFADESITGIATSLAAVDGAAKNIVDSFVSFNTGLQTLAGAANGAAGIIIGQLTKAVVEAGSNNVVQTALDVTVAGATGTVIIDMIDKYFRNGLKTDYHDPNIPVAPNPSSGGIQFPGATGIGNVPYAPPAGSGVITQTFKPTSTKEQWAGKLLAKMGIDKPKENQINAITEWLQHENTADSGYLGERNNPLNVRNDFLGTSLGKDKWKISVFKTEEEGLNETIKALGQQAYGFPAIASAIQGNMDETEIWSRIMGSQWAGGNYINTTTDPKHPTFRYEGNTFNINIPNAQDMDATALAKAIKNIFENDPRTK
jgi:hypothetical protein